MVRLLWAIPALLALAGCSPGMYGMLHRTTDDPEVVKPIIISFMEPYAILARWDPDPAADEYILERAEDNPASLAYETVYEGADTEYADRELGDGLLYIYRLSKRRGKEVFGPSEEAAGISSLINRSMYTNNTMEQAARLETKDYIANLYYYRTYGGLEIAEEAWYYIDIPPLRQASVVVSDSQVAESDTPTHFEYYEYGRDRHPVLHLSGFWIINPEMETKRYYFMLYPAKFQFITAALPVGGDTVMYRISIGQIVPTRAGNLN